MAPPQWQREKKPMQIVRCRTNFDENQRRDQRWFFVNDYLFYIPGHMTSGLRISSCIFVHSFINIFRVLDLVSIPVVYNRSHTVLASGLYYHHSAVRVASTRLPVNGKTVGS